MVQVFSCINNDYSVCIFWDIIRINTDVINTSIVPWKLSFEYLHRLIYKNKEITEFFYQFLLCPQYYLVIFLGIILSALISVSDQSNDKRLDNFDIYFVYMVTYSHFYSWILNYKLTHLYYKMTILYMLE